MQLFIIRHAHALDGSDDAARPLSRKGREQIRAVATFLKRSGRLEAHEFWHSPLVRARDTAVLLADRLGSKVRLVEAPLLAPVHAPELIAAKLQKSRHPVTIIGHEPQLSALASLLVLGRAAPSAFVLKKCAVLALERARGRWAVKWQISPELLG